MSKYLVILCITLFLGHAKAAPIHDAVRSGDLNSIQELITQSPPMLNLADHRGQTPLHHAVIKNQVQAAQWLLEAGAEPGPVDGSGQTPLFIALDRGRKAITMLLLDQGADPTALGSGAVSMAVRAGHLEAVRLMVAQGCPADVTGRNGQSPLALAVAKGQADIAKFLLNQGANPDTKLPGDIPMICWAAAKGRLSVVEILLAEGANPNASSPNGQTALWLARAHGHPDITQVLSAVAPLADAESPATLQQLLEKDLQEGEAVLWHLGHCGWAIRTSDHFLVIDYFPSRWQPNHPSLSNGYLVPGELAGQKVHVFVTHGHRDHFDPGIYPLADIGATFYYGFSPTKYSGPSFTQISPNNRYQEDGITIDALDSNDEGVGFKVTLDGVTVYHAGDHAGWKEGEKINYTTQIDHLAETSFGVDLAFLNVTGCHAHGQCALDDGTQYTLSRLKPRVWFPTHAGDQEHLYADFADRIEKNGIQPTMGIPVFRGETFLYRDGELQGK